MNNFSHSPGDIHQEGAGGQGAMATAGPSTQPRLPAHSTTPAGSGGCVPFPGPAGLQSSITTQPRRRQRLQDFGGGEEGCPFDACFLFSGKAGCVMKRWIRCAENERTMRALPC